MEEEELRRRMFEDEDEYEDEPQDQDEDEDEVYKRRMDEDEVEVEVDIPLGTLYHFSHDHELVLEGRMTWAGGPISCAACEDRVFGPNYMCKQCGEKFVLHKSCMELPGEIRKYPFHSCKHPLILGTTSSSGYACGACHQAYNGGFSYTCCECDFKVDIKCSKIDYQPEHFIHKHPLMLNEDVAEAAGRPVSCSRCKDPVLGRDYYSCNRCSDFILHKSCVELPRNIQHPIHSKHPLILTTPSSIERSDYSMYHCHICRGELFTNGCYYTCDKCKFHLDPKCASNWSNKLCIEHFCHEHLLFFGEIDAEKVGFRPVSCFGCGDPVLGPSYSCTMTGLGSCSFFLHKSCAELPREIGQHQLHPQHPLVLKTKSSEELDRSRLSVKQESYRSGLSCSACEEIFRGELIYSGFPCGFILDLKCASKWISESLEHFSHEHPLLMFNQVDDKEKEEYTGPPVVCDGCQDPVLGPSYTCRAGRKCCYNLHKSCAELPREIQHPAHHKHLLFLLNTFQNIKVACFCNACNQLCRYRYNCSVCDFNLHLNCASNWQKIIDCHQHQFAVPRKEMALNCDICGDGEYRSDTVYYICTICQLLVHKECASLPRLHKIPAEHKHLLKLTWFLEDIYPSKDRICNLCTTKIDKCRAVYLCLECSNYVAHTTCIAVDYFQEQDYKRKTMQDKTANDDDDDDDDGEYHVAGQIKHFSHQHFLVANHSGQAVKGDSVKTCEGCNRPITQDFYSCTKQEDESCHFFLHKTCARLPAKKLLPLLHPHHLTLLTRVPSIGGVFQCYMCGAFNNGFAYSCGTCALSKGENRFYIDLQCTIYWLNRDLKHESHAHRLLLDTEGESVCCRGCGSKITLCFSCKKCDFHLCISCVNIPLTATHRYDEHPLKLTYASVEHEAGQYYCEICEGKRDPTHWFYQCREQCEFDFHPHCIIGRYPQVKLGGAYKHDAHAAHLVTLVSKWKSPIPFDKRDNILPCEKCGKLCLGLVFECKECNINIHREGFCGTVDGETSHKSPQIEELS